MNAVLLGKIFGREQRWLGPCVVVMNAEASMHALGTDSIVGGGAKQYAPRMVSGRIGADACCLTQDGSALIILQATKHRASTGEEKIVTTLVVADTAHIVAVEFPDTNVLANLGLTAPVIRPTSSSHHGTARPMS
jgi:hypothetical protein